MPLRHSSFFRTPLCLAALILYCACGSNARLVSFFDFDDTSSNGRVVEDRVPESTHRGFLNGDAAVTSGSQGFTGEALDCSGGHVRINDEHGSDDHYDFGSTKGYTIHVRIKLLSGFQISGDSDASILGRIKSGWILGSRVLTLSNSRDVTWVAKTDETDNERSQQLPGLEIGRWHQLIFSISHGHTANSVVIKNGAGLGSSRTFHHFGDEHRAGVDTQLLVGKGASNFARAPLTKVLIDDLAIYDTYMSRSELEALVADGPQKDVPQYVCHAARLVPPPTARHRRFTRKGMKGFTFAVGGATRGEAEAACAKKGAQMQRTGAFGGHPVTMSMPNIYSAEEGQLAAGLLDDVALDGWLSVAVNTTALHGRWFDSRVSEPFNVTPLLDWSSGTLRAHGYDNLLQRIQSAIERGLVAKHAGASWRFEPECYKAGAYCESQLEPVAIDGNRRKFIEAFIFQATHKFGREMCASRAWQGVRGTLVSLESGEEMSRFRRLLTDVGAASRPALLSAVRTPNQLAWSWTQTVTDPVFVNSSGVCTGYCRFEFPSTLSSERTATDNLVMQATGMWTFSSSLSTVGTLACQYVLPAPVDPSPLPPQESLSTSYELDAFHIVGSRRFQVAGQAHTCREVFHQGLPGRRLVPIDGYDLWFITQVARVRNIPETPIGGRREGNATWVWNAYEEYRLHPEQPAGGSQQAANTSYVNAPLAFFNESSLECISGFCPWGRGFPAADGVIVTSTRDSREFQTVSSTPSTVGACEWQHDTQRPPDLGGRFPLIPSSSFIVHRDINTDVGFATGQAACAELYGSDSRLARLTNPELFDFALVAARERGGTMPAKLLLGAFFDPTRESWVWANITYRDTDGGNETNAVFFDGTGCKVGYSCPWAPGFPRAGDTGVVAVVIDGLFWFESIAPGVRAAALCERLHGKEFLHAGGSTIDDHTSRCLERGSSPAVIESAQDNDAARSVLLDTPSRDSVLLALLRFDALNRRMLWDDPDSQHALWHVDGNGSRTCLSYCGPNDLHTVVQTDEECAGLWMMRDGTWRTHWLTRVPSSASLHLCQIDRRVIPLKMRPSVRKRLEEQDPAAKVTRNAAMTLGDTAHFGLFGTLPLRVAARDCASRYQKGQPGRLPAPRTVADVDALNAASQRHSPDAPLLLPVAVSTSANDPTLLVFDDVTPAQPFYSLSNGTCYAHCVFEETLTAPLASAICFKAHAGFVKCADTDAVQIACAWDQQLSPTPSQFALPPSAVLGAVSPLLHVGHPLSACGILRWRGPSDTNVTASTVGVEITVDSAEANRILASFALSNQIGRVRLLLTRRAAGTGWVWTDGRSLADTGYSNWAFGHPLPNASFAVADTSPSGAARWLSLFDRPGTDAVAGDCGTKRICAFGNAPTPQTPPEEATPTVTRRTGSSNITSTASEPPEGVPTSEPAAPTAGPSPNAATVSRSSSALVTLPAPHPDAPPPPTSATSTLLEVRAGSASATLTQLADAAVPISPRDAALPSAVTTPVKATAVAGSALVSVISVSAVTKPSLSGRGLRLVSGRGCGIDEGLGDGEDEWPEPFSFVWVFELGEDSWRGRGAGAILSTAIVVVTVPAVALHVAKRYLKASSANDPTPATATQAPPSPSAQWTSPTAQSITIAAVGVAFAYLGPSLVEAGTALLFSDGPPLLAVVLGVIGVAVGIAGAGALWLGVQPPQEVSAASSTKVLFAQMIAKHIVADGAHWIDRAAVVVDLVAAFVVAFVSGLLEAGALQTAQSCQLAIGACTLLLCAAFAYLVVRRPYSWAAEQIVACCMTLAVVVLWGAILLAVLATDADSQQRYIDAAEYLAVLVDVSAIGGAGALALLSWLSPPTDETSSAAHVAQPESDAAQSLLVVPVADSGANGLGSSGGGVGDKSSSALCAADDPAAQHNPLQRL